MVVLFGVRLFQNNSIKDKETSDKLAAQEEQLKQECQTEKEKDIVQYVSDEIFGSFKFGYPKIWSTNVTQEEGASEELMFLADPNLITIDKKKTNTITALRVVVYSDKYETKLAEVEDSNTDTKLLTESDVKVSGIAGKKFIGKDEETGNNVGFILVPLRDKTLYIGTDNYSKYKDQYEKITNSFNLSK